MSDAFFDDLAEDMKDPEFRAAFERHTRIIRRCQRPITGRLWCIWYYHVRYYGR